MISKLKKSWHAVRDGIPGHRFQNRYAAIRRDGEHGSALARLARMALAAIAAAVGLVLVFMPGPAILFFVIAASLVATESLFVARLLDWTEVRLRKLLGWVVERWRKLSATSKFLVTVAMGAIALSSAYASYRVFFY